MLIHELPSYSSLIKEVYNPKAFILHAALLHQAFAHCGRFLTAASRRSLDRVSVPVWLKSGPCLSSSLADHPLRPAMDRRLGRPLPYQLPNPTQASPKAPEDFNPKTICGISYPFGQLFLTLGQIPTRYSAVRRSPTFYTKFLNRSSILPRSFQNSV